MYLHSKASHLTPLSLAICALAASTCEMSADIGFDVNKVLDLAASKAKSNWEWGTHAETLLELENADISVFSEKAFPGGKIPNKQTASTDYAKTKITLGGNTLCRAGVSSADPASLGVSAILLGQSASDAYSEAAKRQVNELLHNVPRYSNGAISHRYDGIMLWSDFVFMVPPTLAYEAVATNDPSLLKEAIHQIALYREALQDTKTGLWTHIIGSRRDAGTWSTGNGWTTGGICRVLATVKHWPSSSTWTKELADLAQYAREIIDGAIEVGHDADSGLLRNYITQPDSMPDAAGTAMMTASVYRLAVLDPGTFATSRYLQWADARREAVIRAVDANGRVYPVANPYDYLQGTPYADGSPEAQDFVVMMYAAYRDCHCFGQCKA